MEYDAKTIGERIKHERKQLTAPKPDGKTGVMSQEDLAAELGYSDRKVVGKWETGKEIPPLDDLLYMCEPHLFDCELGYLLCEFDTKTRAATDIQAETGLSEAAINVLRAEKNIEDNPSKKLPLIEQFILDCTPIAGALNDLFFDSFKQEAQEKLYPETTDTLRHIFDEVYFGDYPKHLKPQIFIDKAIDQIEHGWQGEGYADTSEELAKFQNMQRDRYFSDYEQLADEYKYDKTAMNRYIMNLTFDQIIDKVVNSYKGGIITLTQDIAKKVGTTQSEERKGTENGEHEKK